MGKYYFKFWCKKSDHIIIYDNSDLYSSCRLWFSFIYFGHNVNQVSVLNGGLKKWKIEKKKLHLKLIILIKQIIPFRKQRINFK